MRPMGEIREHFRLSAGFSKQVPQVLEIWEYGQLTKVWGDDFRGMLCCEFGHWVQGVEDVRRNEKDSKFGDFHDGLGFLMFGMGFECLGNLKMMYMMCGEGF